MSEDLNAEKPLLSTVESDRLKHLADERGFLIAVLDSSFYDPSPYTSVAIMDMADVSSRDHYVWAAMMPLCEVEAWIRERTD